MIMMIIKKLNNEEVKIKERPKELNNEEIKIKERPKELNNLPKIKK